VTTLAFLPHDLDIERIESDELVAGKFRLKAIMAGEPPPPPELLVPQLVLGADVNVWVGHGAVGKSTTLLHLAVCVVVGRPVFGTLRPTRAGRVILVLPEDGEIIARGMLEAIVAGMELSPAERTLLEAELYIIEDTAPVNLATDAGLIGRLVEDVGACLVIIDPLQGALGGADEVDPAIAQTVCDRLRQFVCWPTGAAVLLSHHFRKPSNGAPDSEPTTHDMRGSGGWSNHARLVLGFSKKNGSDRITIKGLKSNRVKADLRHEINLRITADEQNAAHWLRCSLADANAGATSTTLAAGVGRSLDQNENAGLGALDDSHEPGRRLSMTDWIETSGLNPNTLKSKGGVKDRLIASGLVQAHDIGTHRNGGKLYAYSITDRGRPALATGWVHHA
jgi:hypothetical protein